ncbi:MAG: OmpA family protein [Melioribacteraceae bacterium]|nr:OmpA family protein [Melioribacteraceae bacterium]MCF8357103.1 OmpA family protein [Melioribacteraceae bacterium]MCF8396064.1 OmpA family protein [Melioribacteraceae bacterium]MCF8418963.1 OmpA family protein [Melioribacteraceae bacterium]
MKSIKYLIITAITAILIGCSASTPPQELVNARQSYQKASQGQAVKLVPAELHKAEIALASAERAFRDDPDSYSTRDLAYIADRKAKMAEGLANSAIEKAATEKANKDYETEQAEIIEDSKEDLAAAEKKTALKTAQLAEEQRARIEAEAALAKLAAKEEERGLVITLSGSVLFASNESVLMPAAQNKLNEVADALLATKERKLTIEGHTDSQGSSSHNMDLAQKRADAVRSYIVSRGYPSNMIFAQGIGEGRPIADNNSAEGRANNRRVEIIIDHNGN